MRRKIALDAASLKMRVKILVWMIYKTCQELFLVSSITVHAIVSIVEVSGTFDDEKITGHGSGSEVGLDLTLSFNLPKSYNCSTDKKIPIPVGQQGLYR